MVPSAACIRTLPRIVVMRSMCALVALAGLSTAVAAPSVPTATSAEAQLRSINHRFVDAFVESDHAFMSALVDDDFVRTTSKGEWQDRDQFVAEFRRPPGMAGASYDDVHVRVFGEVALVHAVFEALLVDGTTRNVRYTDVYRWKGGAWRLVSGQNSVMKDGVPAALQRGVVPAHEPWIGRDPVGNDRDVLLALNASYVNAFREADVGWYDAHLAPDYVVVSSDGSMKDRAAALADFAQPVFATSIRSFPVDKVNVRLFGDVAVIHAENAYELKDGRKAVARYTDIWRRQTDGGWKCIAAHITAHRAPA
jgi:ketosteroid isomerase-like protein